MPRNSRVQSLDQICRASHLDSHGRLFLSALISVIRGQSFDTVPGGNGASGDAAT